MFCTECGRESPDGCIFCTYCGAGLGGTARSYAAKPKPSLTESDLTPFPSGSRSPSKGRSSTVFVALAAAVVVLVIAAATVVILVTRSDTPDASAGNPSAATVSRGSETQTTQTPAGAAAPIASTTSTGGSTTTGSNEGRASEYLPAASDLDRLLQNDDVRIPELAVEINNTAPTVPMWVRDELQTMLDSLSAGQAELGTITVPAGSQESDSWLKEAFAHMSSRISATIQGIEIMWETGKLDSSKPYFDQGREERDAYRAAFARYQATAP